MLFPVRSSVMNVPEFQSIERAAITGEAPDWKSTAKLVETAGRDRQGARVTDLGPTASAPRTRRQ